MKRKFIENPEISEEMLQTALDHAVSQVKMNLPVFSIQCKKSNSTNNFYPVIENVGWTTGFWPGEVWLSYEVAKDEIFAEAGKLQVYSFLDRIEKRIDTDHHDMGFLYTPSCVAAWKLTGNEIARKAAILAAEQLSERFQKTGQFIQAWGAMGVADNYRLIIDCLLNLPLLYWATEETGDNKYAEVARKHTETALKVLIRQDGSTHHTYFFDLETGAPLRGVTAQGYSSNSAWARGQAWGIYGIALAYRYMRKPEYLELFEKVADFYISRLPQNMIPYWDLSFEDGCGEPWDSSAAAIASCGILEMSEYLEEDKAEYYRQIAKKTVRALVETCAVSDFSQSNGQLLHGTYAKKSEFNTIDDRGVDECNGWGDYFYFEALVRLAKNWKPYW